MAGWIKVFREFADWEWFAVPEMVQVFIYLLINANFEDKKWQGKVVEKGQLITSVDSIKCATHLSPKQIRTCLSRLEQTGEICRKTTNKYTLITISNYERYQSSDEYEGQTKGKQKANEGQTKGNQRATTKEYNNIRNNNISLSTHAHTHEETEFVDADLVTEEEIQFESAWRMYGEYGSQTKAMYEWNLLRIGERKKVLDNIPLYLASLSDIRYKKYFENYLRDRIYEINHQPKQPKQNGQQQGIDQNTLLTNIAEGIARSRANKQ
jgi:hypothetical protein